MFRRGHGPLSAAQHHQRHRVTADAVVGDDFERDIRNFRLEHEQESERRELGVERHGALHRTHAVLVPPELREREREVVRGIRAFRRQGRCSLERTAGLVQAPELGKCHADTDPGARVLGISFRDPPESLEALGMATELTHDPGGIESRSEFDTR